MPPAVESLSSDAVAIRESVAEPVTKKPKHAVGHQDQNTAAAFRACQRVMLLQHDQHALPTSLHGSKTKNELDKLRALLDQHGLRTSILASPRRALSVYKDSCCLFSGPETKSNKNDGKEFLVVMLGLHPQQIEMERLYAESFKNLCCLRIFCLRIRQACSKAVQQSEKLSTLLQEGQTLCQSLSQMEYSNEAIPELQVAAQQAVRTVAQIQQLAVAADTHLRPAQLEHEYNRIVFQNSTLSNAYLSILVDHHGLVIKDVYFKHSHLPQYERITIYLYDSDIDERTPPRFTFLPSLRLALDQGAEAVAKFMTEFFWNNLLRRGYFPTSKLQDAMGPMLERYFLSGLANNPSIPLLL